VGTVRLGTVQLTAADIMTAGLTDSCHVCLGVCVCVCVCVYGVCVCVCGVCMCVCMCVWCVCVVCVCVCVCVWCVCVCGVCMVCVCVVCVWCVCVYCTLLISFHKFILRKIFSWRPKEGKRTTNSSNFSKSSEKN